jgi:hypothetical protein
MVTFGSWDARNFRSYVERERERERETDTRARERERGVQHSGV